MTSTDRVADPKAVRTRYVVRAASTAAAAPYLLCGLVAVAQPAVFYDTFAAFRPYNAHLIRDIGALDIGIALGVILAAWMRDAGMAVLCGFATFQGLHLWSHLIDIARGGHPLRDLSTFAGTLALTGAAGWARWCSTSRASSTT